MPEPDDPIEKKLPQETTLKVSLETWNAVQDEKEAARKANLPRPTTDQVLTGWRTAANAARSVPISEQPPEKPITYAHLSLGILPEFEPEFRMLHAILERRNPGHLDAVRGLLKALCRDPGGNWDALQTNSDPRQPRHPKATQISKRPRRGNRATSKDAHPKSGTVRNSPR